MGALRSRGWRAGGARGGARGDGRTTASWLVDIAGPPVVKAVARDQGDTVQIHTQADRLVFEERTRGGPGHNAADFIDALRVHQGV